jgi:hypothetical protein
MNTTNTKPLSKVAILVKLKMLGYRVAPLDATNPGHYGRASGWLEAANGERVYVNFRDFLAELTKE